MVAGEFFPINGFDARDLIVCQRGEFSFPPSARKRAAVLVEEPEQEIRQAIWHIDDQVQVVPKCVATASEMLLLAANPVRSSAARYRKGTRFADVASKYR